MSEVAREAAAGVLDDLAAEFVEEPAVEAQETPVSGPEETVAEAEAQHETEQEVPDEIRALIDEPDFDAEAEAEVEAEQPEEAVYDEYETPELAEERKKRIAAEKKAQWLEEQRVRENRGKWVAEARKYFKYADPDSIQAGSRRNFLKQASAQHDAIKGRVEAALVEERARMLAEVAAEKETAKAEQAAAWGRPLAGPGGPPPSTAAAPERARARNASVGLRDTIRARLDAGLVDLGFGGGEEQ